MALLVHKATLEPLAHKVLQVPQVLMVTMALLVHKATLEPLAHKVTRDQPGPLAAKAHKGTQGPKVPPELQPQFYTQWSHPFRQVAPATR